MNGLVIRSLLFNVGWYLGSAVIAVAGAPLLLLPRRAVVMWARFWIRFCLAWLWLTCRLRHRISGWEKLPPGPAIVAAKHQSSWETIAFPLIFRDTAIVVKRELLFIPIVGWAIARAGHIAVARGDGAPALRGLLRRARAELAKRRSILIFPAGTRVAPGAERPYQVGIAALYRHLNVPVVPVALNSGLFWGRRKFLKYSGVIEVEILPAIAPGLGREEFMTELHRRIETATLALGRARPN